MTFAFGILPEFQETSNASTSRLGLSLPSILQRVQQRGKVVTSVGPTVLLLGRAEWPTSTLRGGGKRARVLVPSELKKDHSWPTEPKGHLASPSEIIST